MVEEVIMLEHRFAKLSIAATFLLLLIGGTVNPTGSSLACPEPTLVCHGELFPEMTGGVLYEHGHRLAGMTVGLLQIALTVLLWRRRKDLRWLGVGALGLVIVQGSLGALTVAFKLPWAVSTLHLLVAQLYIGLLIYIASRTSKSGVATNAARQRVADLRNWIATAAGLVLVQIVLGGLMRHNGGALASLDFPLHQGSIWPSDAPIALQLHMAHRWVGVLVGLYAMAVAGAVFRQARGWTTMRLLAALTPVLVGTQVLLGSLTILYLRPVPVVVAHFTIGVGLWILWFSMLLMARRAAAEVRGS